MKVAAGKTWKVWREGESDRQIEKTERKSSKQSISMLFS